MTERVSSKLATGAADIFTGRWAEQLLIYVPTLAIAVGVALILDIGGGIPEQTVVLITVGVTLVALFFTTIIVVLSPKIAVSFKKILNIAETKSEAIILGFLHLFDNAETKIERIILGWELADFKEE